MYTRRDVLKSAVIAASACMIPITVEAYPKKKILTGFKKFDKLNPEGLQLGTMCHIHSSDEAKNEAVANFIQNNNPKIKILRLNDLRLKNLHVAYAEIDGILKDTIKNQEILIVHNKIEMEFLDRSYNFDEYYSSYHISHESLVVIIPRKDSLTFIKNEFDKEGFGREVWRVEENYVL